MNVAERAAAALKKAGGFYTLADLARAVTAGEMQGFVKGETWVVTRVCQFPQKRALEIVLAVGNLDELKALEPDIEAFGKEHGCVALFADARAGFDKRRTDGWKMISASYVKDLTDGE